MSSIWRHPSSTRCWLLNFSGRSLSTRTYASVPIPTNPLRNEIHRSSRQSVLSSCRRWVPVGLSGVQQSSFTISHGKCSTSMPASTTLSDSELIGIDVNGHMTPFHAIFLRDSCSCAACIDPSTRQKLFQTADIPLELRPRIEQSTDETVRLSWENDVAGFSSDHETVISKAFLADVLALQTKVLREKTEDPQTQLYWDAAQMEKENSSISYHDYQSTAGGVFEIVDRLWRYGLAFLKDVPDEVDSIEKIATRIGPLRNSFYGTTWDVRSIPNSKNIAYTDKFLGLHMDLLYMVNPPRIQILHSLRARAPGGASMFSDSFRAAELLQRSNIAGFRSLATFPVTYHYDNDGQHYRFTRPTVELVGITDVNSLTDSDLAAARIERINWSPPFQGPFSAGFGVHDSAVALKSYLAAAKTFNESLNSEEHMYEYRLKEGEAVVFDNRRVLHARRAFDAQGGERWLRGGYVDEDVWKSQIRVAGKRISDNQS